MSSDSDIEGGRDVATVRCAARYAARYAEHASCGLLWRSLQLPMFRGAGPRKRLVLALEKVHVSGFGRK